MISSGLISCKKNGEENADTDEGAGSGMDNTPRGRESVPSKDRPNNPDMLWIDAICQQALSARSIARLFDIVGDRDSASEWNAKRCNLELTYYL